MLKSKDNVELPLEDEFPEAPNLIRMRAQSKQKAEYISDASTTSAPEARRSWRDLGEKAEYVEPDEGETHNKQVKKCAEKSSTSPSLSILPSSWMLFLVLTDESEAACEKFIYNGGLSHFMACYDENPNDKSLLTLMMATLSNLSEHTRLRAVIMNVEFIAISFILLDSEFSISECAASVLCNLASEGPRFWNVEKPSWESTLEKIETVIDSWNPDVRMKFQYNSLKPFLNLVRIYNVPPCRKYALWILKNLLSDGVRGELYREMMKKEGGKSVLKKIMKSRVSSKYIKTEAESLLKKLVEPF